MLSMNYFIVDFFLFKSTENIIQPKVKQKKHVSDEQYVLGNCVN